MIGEYNWLSNWTGLGGGTAKVAQMRAVAEDGWSFENVPTRIEFYNRRNNFGTVMERAGWFDGEGRFNAAGTIRAFGTVPVPVYSGTPVAGRLAQWTGTGTVTHSDYAGSVVARYSGAPTAGRYAYWTANGTVADSGFGTSQLPRYSGTPTAGALTYWTANGTVTHAGFGTADVVQTSGNQTIAGNKTLTGQTEMENAANPVLKVTRNEGGSQGVKSTLSFKAKRTDAMADGYGPGLVFLAEDDDAVENVFGSLAAVRDGADNSAAIVVRTTSSGVTTEAARFTANNRLGIGATVPAAKVHIDQSSTTAAIPVLTLDQADLSEEMIEFETTVGAGNPIDTAAIGTYYGKVRVSVAGVGYKYIALYNT